MGSAAGFQALKSELTFANDGVEQSLSYESRQGKKAGRKPSGGKEYHGGNRRESSELAV
jgi:hypothetical protein